MSYTPAQGSVDHMIWTPLTINLDRLRDEKTGLYMYTATSPQHPELCGTSVEAANALFELMFHVNEAMEDINDARPLLSTVVDALLSAGHPLELIEKWDQDMRGGRLRELRYDADAALSVLNDYKNCGVPSMAACGFVAINLAPETAAIVHAAGRTPQEARPYVEVARTGWWHSFDFDPVEWLLANFPVERIHLYVHQYSPHQAEAWEAVVRQHDISDANLRDILRADFSLEAVEEKAAADADAGHELGEAARTLLGLAWRNNPWGLCDGDEPPF